MEEKIWMPVRGYEGIYEVSSNGEVERVLIGHGTKGGLLKPCVNKCKRVVYGLGKNGVNKTHYAHHLVLSSFNCEKPDGLICCHYDGNPFNNHISNLRWDTSQGNSDDMVRHGTVQRGQYASRAKLKDSDMVCIKKLIDSKVMLKDIAKMYRVDRSIISKINSGKIWKHI